MQKILVERNQCRKKKTKSLHIELVDLLDAEADEVDAIAAGEFFSRNFLFMFTALNFLCGWDAEVEDWEPNWTRVGRAGVFAGRVSAMEVRVEFQSLDVTEDRVVETVSETLLASSLTEVGPAPASAGGTETGISSLVLDSDGRVDSCSVFAINASEDACWSEE